MIRNLFVEYRGKGSGNERWSSFSGVIRLERDYFIFARLAGIGGDVKDALVLPEGFQMMQPEQQETRISLGSTMPARQSTLAMFAGGRGALGSNWKVPLRWHAEQDGTTDKPEG
jgi:hypothetical protein